MEISNYMKWWNDLSEDEQNSILKQEEIFGHDEGVTESEVKDFYERQLSK